MQNKNSTTIILVLIALAFGLFFMFKATPEDTQTPIEVISNDEIPEPTESTETVAEVKTFEVANAGFTFTPSEIKVKQGDTVRIAFTNTGGMHDWVVDEFDARTEVTQTGETSTVEFVADKAGEFEFYCSIMTHRAMGMVGTLIVE